MYQHLGAAQEIKIHISVWKTEGEEHGEPTSTLKFQNAFLENSSLLGEPSGD